MVRGSSPPIYVIGDANPLRSGRGMLTSAAGDDAACVAERIAARLGRGRGSSGSNRESNSNCESNSSCESTSNCESNSKCENRENSMYPVSVWAPLPYASGGVRGGGLESIRARWRTAGKAVGADAGPGEAGGVLHVERDSQGVARIRGVEVAAPGAADIVQALVAGGVLGRATAEFARSRTLHPTAVEHLVHATREWCNRSRRVAI